MDKQRMQVRRQRREEFLQILYDEVDGSVNEFVDGHAIAARVGADPDEARRIVAYFEEKGWVMVDDHKNGIIRLTAAGIDVVEAQSL
jgi:hypothetical protein